MGLFDKFKNILKTADKEEIENYHKGLEKTRNHFSSQLGLLSKKY